MIDIKKLLNSEKIKPLAVAATCFATVFAVGYAAGKSVGTTAEPAKRSLSNYTTNTATHAKPTTPTTRGDTTPANSSLSANTNTSNTGECHIKGSKSKTYHIPGGAFYERTSPAACFASEEEAQSAGYKKSSR